MEKVYVVEHWTLSGDEETTVINGIFDTREKAQAYIDVHEGHPANNDWNILEFEVQ